MLRLTLLLVGVAFAGTGVYADGDKKVESKPMPTEIVKVWSDAGAEPGWMKDIPDKPAKSYWETFLQKDETGAIPAFRFHPKDKAILAMLPDPGVAFGIDFHCSSITEPDLKNMAGLKSLQSLNVGASLLLDDAALKELVALKNLQTLYLFYTGVTDAGMQEIAKLKNLQTLDLSHTRITDAGLIVLAKIKNLRSLNIQNTKVTKEGIVAVQKALPQCNIYFSND